MHRAVTYLAVLSVGILIGWAGHRTGRVDNGHPDNEHPDNGYPDTTGLDSAVGPRDDDELARHSADHVTPALPQTEHGPMQRDQPVQTSLRTTDGTPAGPPTDGTDRDPSNGFPSGRQPSVEDSTDNEELLEAMRMSCQFDPGFGAHWYTGSLSAPATSAWQGGLITYDITDLNAGVAMMSGTQGATGSPTGSVKVHVAATTSGLSFSSFVPRGDLITTTVFGALDNQGRHRAVMSTHGQDTHASQFYGSCDAF